METPQHILMAVATQSGRKTADLAVVQKMSIDTLHMDGTFGIVRKEEKRKAKEEVHGCGEGRHAAALDIFHQIPPKMSTKRKLSLSTPQPAKKERKAIDLDTKMKIIKQYEEGKKVNVIARGMKLSHSTVSTILKDKERIREAVKGSAPMRSTVITKQRSGHIHEMEQLLYIWMEEQIQKRTPLSLFTVQMKARSLFQTLKERAGEDYYSQEFVASTGWFQRFKKRFQMHSGEAASADEEGTCTFVDSLDKLITDEGYLAEQIFNVDETGLFWKRMPACTYIHKEAQSMPGFKAYKDRLTLLLGGNVAGFKLKPFLIYHSENPRAFKNVNKHTLPVYFRSQRKAWMTQGLFEDWFMNCFIPQVREYCLKKDIPFKILMLLDNAPGHPPHIGDLHPDVKIVFLPPNTTPLIQPMDQGSIATFRANYLQTTFAQAVSAMDADSELTLQDFWKRYNILMSIKNIATAWEAVTTKCMNGIWKNCVKRYVNDFDGFHSEHELETIQEKIVKLAKDLSLECEMQDVKELLEEEPGELTNEELIELEEERVAEEERREAEKEEEEPERKFTTEGLSEAPSQHDSQTPSAELDIRYGQWCIKKGIQLRLSRERLRNHSSIQISRKEWNGHLLWCGLLVWQHLYWRQAKTGQADQEGQLSPGDSPGQCIGESISMYLEGRRKN
ncbi:hypothetical protein C0J50_14224 [Silurus asotus]|uniref:HTH CENPB-type domain-containing protein n=1 Tax=Silurus asotus TaxID=30991 RepID=A0AAD5FS83_SILAS|nr:hypothetical protein C0J50_14224 [Silurus asotus]